MIKGKVLALILAGGVGGRLETLTENRAKPVMPFGGSYRLIDFALSNCAHSGIGDVWIIEQYELHSLNEHLSNGRPWDLDRTYGGLQVLPPFENKSDDSDGGFASGNADAIYRHRKFIKSFNPDILLVLSADHIYKLDFREVIEAHLKNRADVTMVTTKVPANESASRFGVVKTDKKGRVKEFQYKPENPESDLITTEVFVYDAPKLLKTLDKLANESGDSENALKDFGHKLIPYLVESGSAFEFRYKRYWRDVGTVSSYWRANMDLLDGKTDLDLDDENWAILTLAAPRVPAYISAEAKVTNSFISNGCKIYGHVSHSILAPGVTVEKGAEIMDSIILPDVIIKKGARVRAAIVDAKAIVNENAVIGLFGENQITPETNLENEEITIIGMETQVAASKTIKAGARISNDKS